MFAREGYTSIIITLVFALIVGIGASYIGHWVRYVIYGALIVLAGLILYFFRDPDREITPGDGYVLSPADGKVVLIKEVEEEHYIQGPALQRSEERRVGKECRTGWVW